MTDNSIFPWHIFIDANTALHFKRPDQIDWCALTGAKEVVLVAAPLLVRELEIQKVHNPSYKLRERADTFIRWLVTFVRNPSVEVRLGVRWHFIPHEPQIDFSAHNLSDKIADDRLIASVLTYTAEPNGPVYVATADVGLEIKLRARTIDIIEIPESEKLPAESDPRDKELKKLREQVALFKGRQPELFLSFGDGAEPLEIQVPPPATQPSVPSLAEIRLKNPLKTKKQQGEQKEKSDRFEKLIGAIREAGFIEEAIDSQNKDLEEYYKKYSDYLDNFTIWQEQVRLTNEVTLTLSNNGTAPASNIDVVLVFPNDIVLFDRDNFPKRPDEPKPPGQSLTESLFSSMVPGQSYPLYDFINRDGLGFDGIPDINHGKNEVTISLSSLKHGFSEEFKPFYFCFPTRDVVRSFSVEFDLSADELPNSTVGKAHVVIPKK